MQLNCYEGADIFSSLSWNTKECGNEPSVEVKGKRKYLCLEVIVCLVNSVSRGAFPCLALGPTWRPLASTVCRLTPELFRNQAIINDWFKSNTRLPTDAVFRSLYGMMVGEERAVLN
jgi:hypothetical protein